MKTIGWDDQMCHFQAAKFTYVLGTEKEDGINEVFKQMTRSTYFLETDEKDEM